MARWRSELFRVWLVLSVLWVGLGSLGLYPQLERYQKLRNHDRKAVEEVCRQLFPFREFTGDVTPCATAKELHRHRTKALSDSLEGVAVVAGVPIAAFLLGFVGLWVIKEFRE